MTVYRLVKQSRSLLDGEGSALFPGRWNCYDVPCIYTAMSPALAQLEVMVNLDAWKIFQHVPFVLLHIKIPEKQIRKVLIHELPSSWDDSFHQVEAQEFGTTILDNPEILAFSVPSALSILERNVIINSRAVDFNQVRVTGRTPFNFDSRLIR